MRGTDPAMAGQGCRALVWTVCCLLVLTVLLSAPARAIERDRATVQIDAHVVKEGDTVTVDAFIRAPVPPRQAWEVLSDFDHMAQFVPNMQYSRVISKPGEPLVVAQKGIARYGPFQFSYDTERTIDLTPPTSIRAHLVRGNMRKMDSIMRLSAEGEGTRLTYHAETIAGFWLPPLVSQSFIRHEVEEQFGAIVEEMKRRNDAHPAHLGADRGAVAATPPHAFKLGWARLLPARAVPQYAVMASAFGR